MKRLFNRNKRVIKIASVAITILMVISVCCAVYVGDYYRANTVAIEAFASAHDGNIKRMEPKEGVVVYAPNEPRGGLIFYPGGKVEYTAYEPLMRACADEGILCVLVKMPFNLAVLDVNAADGVRDMYPEVNRWFIGGHSLGGSMAASYSSEHADELEGLVLLASYAATDLSNAGLKVMSVYGSNDGVLDMERYKQNRAHLPQGFNEFVIDGGCHAGFGMYGPQKGDGIPAITTTEQINLTADVVAEFISDR